MVNEILNLIEYLDDIIIGIDNFIFIYFFFLCGIGNKVL